MIYSVLVAASAIVIYTWVAYPLLLWLGRLWYRSRATVSLNSPEAPLVSIIIPVRNEQETIAAKLDNCLDLDHPHDRLEILVASDASTDGTKQIVSQFLSRGPVIQWLECDTRIGKSSVQNFAAGQAHGDILCFTDAKTIMAPESLRMIIDDFAEPEVGLVTAEVHFGRSQDAVEKGQGIYWRYELFLRSLESDLGILATGSGQALAVRRQLFRPLPASCGDDCILPLDVRLQGYKVIQDRKATAFDSMPHSIESELHARIRMTARNWAGTLSRPALLNPMRFPMTALGLVSHKLLRWLTPLLLALVFLSNAILVLEGRAIALWWLQVSFYVSALVGWELTRKQRRASVFGYSFSFCLANLGFLLGIVKALRGEKIVAY